MRRALAIGALAAAAGCLAFTVVNAEEEKPKHTIKEVMAKAHKQGGDELLKKARGGTASEEELKELVACYTSLTKQKPPKGEEKSWKEKTTALLKAAETLAKAPKDKEAQEALGKAANCMACHKDHKAA